MANSSDCFPKAGAFLETAPSPFIHPMANARGGQASLAPLYKQEIEAFTAHRPCFMGLWAPGSHAGVQASCGSTIRSHSRMSPLGRATLRLYKCSPALWHLWPQQPNLAHCLLCVNKVLSEQTCLFLLYCLWPFLPCKGRAEQLGENTSIKPKTFTVFGASPAPDERLAHGNTACTRKPQEEQDFTSTWDTFKTQ